ncbi:hypothetical protein L0664_03920 [Octadecabacter sp. G9-8]|uniref:Uncharacterized protein n=1 Tax=Octadecabacter dasysiphoniae TaxID=2909341 RepID=A0ABS9CTN0_9RHOB|nr:hypothetical protein [Octadecabacter dasysiphoniae]MCF2870204.1 hypothetical protein [Octadecabacter dasysiphoniae]
MASNLSFAAVAKVLIVRKSAMRNEADLIVGVANGGFSYAEIVAIRIRVEIRRLPRVRKIITPLAPADIQLIAYMGCARGVESCRANAVQDLVERTFCRG